MQTENVAHVVLFLDRVTTGYPGLMQMHADHFSADPFPLHEFIRLRTKSKVKIKDYVVFKGTCILFYEQLTGLVWLFSIEIS